MRSADMVVPRRYAARNPLGKPHPRLDRRVGRLAERAGTARVITDALRQQGVPAANIMNQQSVDAIFLKTVDSIAPLVIYHNDLCLGADTSQIVHHRMGRDRISVHHTEPQAVFAAMLRRDLVE